MSADPYPALAPSDADAVDLLHRMVDVASVSGDEGTLGGLLVGWMTDLGLTAHLDEVGNAVGEPAGAAGPTVLLLGHMDTVPGIRPVRREGSLLYGRGAVDAKGALAAFVVAAARLGPDAGIRPVVVGAVEEERTSIGARHLVGRHRPDAVVIGEPSGASRIVLGYKGVLRFEYTVDRPRTHTSSPEEKAAEVAAEFWWEVRDLLSRRYPDGPQFDRAVPALVGVAGDIEHARLDVSCRIPPGFDPEWFREALEAIARGGRVRIVEHVPAVRSGRTDAVARALGRAARRRTGGATFAVKLGTSDMNIVGPAWRVPIAGYGPGDSHLDHTDDEHIDLREFLLSVEVLTDALTALGTGTEIG